MGRTHIELINRFIKLLKVIDGKKGVSEIAKELEMRVSTVSDYITVLEELGLVETTITHDIPRRRVPKLTKRGECFLRCFVS